MTCATCLICQADARQANGLQIQPRVVPLPEKDGRRHAHFVFLGLDPASTTAIKLGYDKNRLISGAAFVLLNLDLALRSLTVAK